MSFPGQDVLCWTGELILGFEPAILLADFPPACIEVLNTPLALSSAKELLLT